MLSNQWPSHPSLKLRWISPALDHISHANLQNFYIILKHGMDPVSIVGSVGSVVGVVFNLSTKLYSFIQATKVVDKSIEALYDEVKALENILNTTQTTLTATVRDYAEDCSLSVHGLWTSIDNGVQDCRVTVEALNSLVQNIGQNTETSNPFRKMLKQVKLNLNTDEVSAVRSRVHTHSICLQLAMQTLSVYVSHLHLLGR